MYQYRIFNLTVQSELPFPELRPDQATPPDIYVQFANGANYTNDRQTLVTEVPEAKLVIRYGRQIIVKPHPDTEAANLRALILGPCMAVLLRQRGLFALHASAVAYKGRAVAFVGDAGWGKSTLAMALNQQGWPLVSDDILAVDMDRDRPTVLPAFPQIKVWPDTAVNLGHSLERLPKLVPQLDKRFHLVDDRFQQTPLPLGLIYILGWGRANKIEALAPAEAFVQLVRNTRAVKSLTAAEQMRHHFEQCSRLIAEIPIRVLRRKVDLSSLTALTGLIQTDLEANLK